MIREMPVIIDGETVTLECDRLTVKAYDVVTRLTGVRGSKPIDEPRSVVLKRLGLIDQHVNAKPGELTVDGVPVTAKLSRLFAFRVDVIATIYSALLDAQRLSAAQEQDLLMATRFNHWLEQRIEDKSTSDWVKTGTSCAKCQQLKLCARRGCDGVEKKKVVWYSKGLLTYTCPVLSFTPEIESTLRLFYWSHQLVSDYAGLRWKQIHMISPGGLEDQDVWTVSAFSALRRINTEMMDTK